MHYIRLIKTLNDSGGHLEALTLLGMTPVEITGSNSVEGMLSFCVFS